VKFPQYKKREIMEHFLRQIEALASDVIQGVEDPLKAYAILKDVQKQVKEALEGIAEDVLNEASKHEKQFELHGFRFEQKNGKANYAYSHIPEIVTKEIELKALKELSKQAYKMSQTGLEVVNIGEGQMITPALVTYSKDSVIVK
jgi:hypothetical protein